jgi:hypothetical protein
MHAIFGQTLDLRSHARLKILLFGKHSSLLFRDVKEKIDKNRSQEDVEYLFEKCSKPKQQQMAESEILWLLAASNGHLGPMLLNFLHS